MLGLDIHERYQRNLYLFSVLRCISGFFFLINKLYQDEPG